MQLNPDAPLSMIMVPSAQATPFMFDPPSRAMSGCIYDAGGARIDISQRVSGVGGDRVKNADPARLPQDFRAAAVVHEPCLYLGFMMNHYGHFIVETLSTFWALEHTPPKRVAFSKFIFPGDMPGYARKVLAACGITQDRVHLIEKPTVFDSLIVPQRTFGLNAYFHRQHAVTTRRIRDLLIGESGDQMDEAPKRVFLSRAELPMKDRTVSNQREIEQVFAEHGFAILHPEKLDITDQMRVFREAEVIAGFSGSALHNVLFMRKGATVIELCDLRNKDFSLPTQRLCDAAAEARNRHIVFVPKSGSDREAHPGAIENALTDILADLS